MKSSLFFEKKTKHGYIERLVIIHHHCNRTGVCFPLIKCNPDVVFPLIGSLVWSHLLKTLKGAPMSNLLWLDGLRWVRLWDLTNGDQPSVDRAGRETKASKQTEATQVIQGFYPAYVSVSGVATRRTYNVQRLRRNKIRVLLLCSSNNIESLSHRRRPWLVVQREEPIDLQI